MCAETINETINVCKYVGSARKSSNVEGDVILQDIKPDILSIVRVTRDLCVTQKKEMLKAEVEKYLTLQSQCKK